MALMVLFLGGCSDPQKKGPTPTAIAFLDAMQKEDYSQAKAYCTETSASQIDRYEMMAKKGGSIFSEAYKIKGENINGSKAEVDYEQGGKGKKLKLLKRNEKWQIALSKTDFGNKVEDNLEEGIEESFEKLGEGFEKLGEELEKGLEELSEMMDTVSFDMPPPPPMPRMPVIEEPAEEEEEEDPGIPTGEIYLEYRKGKTAREIAEKFLTALKYTDMEAARRYVSKNSQSALDWYATSSSSPWDDFSIVEVVKDGDYRQVHYVDASLDSATKILKLGKDSQGNWEVLMTKSDLNDM